MFYRDDREVRDAQGRAVPTASVYYLTNQPGATPSSVNLLLTVSTFTDATGSVADDNPKITNGLGQEFTYVQPGVYAVAVSWNGTVQQVFTDQNVAAGPQGPPGTFSTAVPAFVQTVTINIPPSSTSGIASLAAPPTIGNTLILILQGNLTGVTVVPPVGLTLLASVTGGDLVGNAYVRQVQPGDTANWSFGLSSTPGISYLSVSEIAGTPIVTAASGTATVDLILSTLTTAVVLEGSPASVFSAFCTEHASSAFAWTGFAPSFYSGTVFSSSGAAAQQAVIGFGSGSVVPNQPVVVSFNPADPVINTPIYINIICATVPVGATGPAGPQGATGPAASGASSVYYIIDGGGSTPATGLHGTINIPSDCTITGWSVLADAAGSAVIDVLRSTYDDWPTVASITGGNYPALSSAQKNEAIPATGWTTSLLAGDVLQISLTSVTTCERLCLTIFVAI